MNFTGIWYVVSSSVRQIRQSGNRVEGEYHIRLQTGNIDVRLEGKNRITFSFEGMDEMDEVSGAGTAILDGKHFTFTLMYHFGDDFIFECKRQRERKHINS